VRAVNTAAADPASAHQRCVLSISDDDRNVITIDVHVGATRRQWRNRFRTFHSRDSKNLLLIHAKRPTGHIYVYYTRKFYHSRVYADTPDFVARNETRMPIGQVGLRIRSILIGIYTLVRIRAMVFNHTRIGGGVRPKCNGPPGEPYESNWTTRHH